MLTAIKSATARAQSDGKAPGKDSAHRGCSQGQSAACPPLAAHGPSHQPKRAASPVLTLLEPNHISAKHVEVRDGAVRTCGRSRLAVKLFPLTVPEPES